MRFAYLVTALLIGLGLSFTGCKKKQSEDPAATGSAIPVAGDADVMAVAVDAAAATGDITFGEGESYYGGARSPTNVYEWKTPDGKTVTLVVVATGSAADGRQGGALRVYQDGKGANVGRKFSLATSGDNWAELKQLSNDRVLFRYGDAGDGPGARQAVILRYDSDKKEVVVVKHWAGAAKTEEPGWLATGEYKPAEVDTNLCTKIVARMVACAKDEEFRKSLTARDDDATRAASLASFDKDVATWNKADAAKQQCGRWATADYVETTFGDRVKLERLAKDAAAKNVDCRAFGAEIVDEGGLPQLARR
jgi:hypothetical protein